MRKIVLFVAVLLGNLTPNSAHAHQVEQSGKNEIWDNPFIAYGYNPKTRLITGYVAALKTAPGRTDECKLVFAGNRSEKQRLSVKHVSNSTPAKKTKQFQSHALLTVDGNVSYLKFNKNNLEGECGWVLPFVVESEKSEVSDEVTVEMAIKKPGDWIAVHVIDADRARFHSRPDVSTVQKSYLIKGDVIYVYDENADWYFVKYEEGKRKTEGWIKKADTL